jgi:polyhydroxybutyrate depolymerase
VGCASGSDLTLDPPTVASVVHRPELPPPAADRVSTPEPPETASDACSGKARQPLDGIWTIYVGRDARTFRLHVPSSYDPTAATPVVLNFHGFGSNGEQQDQLSGMSAKADQSGFVAVHPEGLGDPQSWNAGNCCGFAQETNVDDVSFVNAMLDELEARLCVDPHRIFVTGMSNGAFFAERLGCELASRVAAIAPVAGVLVEPTCSPTRPVPVMEFHGTLDPLEPFEGDPAIGLPSAPDDFADWAMRDGCPDELTQTYDDRDSECASFERCAEGTQVTLCTIQGGGHTWPGGEPLPWLGYTTPYLSATEAMWAFFQGHALR